MVSGPKDEEALRRARDLAWAEALAGLSRVAATLSTRLRDIHSDDVLESPAAVDGAKAAGSSPDRVRSPRGGFGPRQQAILALGGLDGIHGLSASEVARSLGLRQQNAHNTLAGLEGQGQLERVPDERPIRWRRAQP